MANDIGVIKRWGDWKLLAEDHGALLEHKSGYRVDFLAMGTAAGMLDIIFQVERKRPMVSTEAVGQLVTALADIFDAQDSLCKDGIEHPFDPKLRLLETIDGFGRSRTP